MKGAKGMPPLKRIFSRLFSKKRKAPTGFIDVREGQKKQRGPFGNSKTILIVLAVLLGGGSFLVVSLFRSMSMQSMAETQQKTLETLRENSLVLEDLSQKVQVLEQRTDLYVSREELAVTIETMFKEMSKGVSSENSAVEGNLEKRIDALEESVRLTARVLQDQVEEQIKTLEKKQAQKFEEDPPETLEEIAGVSFEEPSGDGLSPATPVKFSRSFQQETEKEIRLTKMAELYSILSQVSGGLPAATAGEGAAGNSAGSSALGQLQQEILALALEKGGASASAGRRTLDPNENGMRERSSLLESGIDEREGWPVGTRFSGLLETGLASVNGGCIARVRITEPILYKGYTMIPKDSFFVGYAEPDWDARRLTVTISKLVIENVEFPINASLEDPKGRPGIVSKVIEPEALAASKSALPLWAAALLRAASGVAVTEISVAEGLIGVVQDTDSNADTGLLAASDWFAQQAQLQAAAASKRPPVILANPGANVKVVLLEKLPHSPVWRFFKYVLKGGWHACTECLRRSSFSSGPFLWGGYG